MKKVSVFLADGFEEIEGLTVVDVLRRAGAQTTMVSVTGDLLIHGSHHIDVRADVLFEDMDFHDASMLVLPGGMPGTLHLEAHEGLAALLETFVQKEKKIAAICAAPSILGKRGYLKGRKACCYPSFEEQLDGADVVMSPAVTDGNITTGRGMGVAVLFALELVKVLYGQEKADELKKEIVYE